MRKASDNADSMEQLRVLMERQLEQLVHLVNDLLDIARVSSGRMTLKRERVALQAILNAAVEASEPLRITTKNSLTLELPAAPLYLEADATRLTQVFTNILNNAAQYSAAGGPVTVRVESDQNQVRIDIADAGVGIARDALNRIRQGAQHLQSIAIVHGDAALVPYRFPDLTDIFYLGFCHGPAGTARTFFELHTITGDQGYKQWTERLANGVVQSGIPEDRRGRV